MNVTSLQLLESIDTAALLPAAQDRLMLIVLDLVSI